MLHLHIVYEICQLLVGGLEHFSIYWEESSQLTNIVQRGRSTTNQINMSNNMVNRAISMGCIAWQWLPAPLIHCSGSLTTTRGCMYLGNL